MRQQRKAKRQSRPRRGAALVEFALVVPVFISMVAGIMEFGRAMVVQQALTNASREGARVAGFMSTTETSKVTNAVNGYLSNVGITGATTTVAPQSLSSLSLGSPVTVTVSIPFNQVNWMPHPFFLRDTVLQATSAMCRQP